jgi:hypothetical protein
MYMFCFSEPARLRLHAAPAHDDGSDFCMRVIDGLEIWTQQPATYSIGFLGMYIGSSKRSRVLVQAQGDERLANKKLRILTMLQKQHVKATRRENMQRVSPVTKKSRAAPGALVWLTVPILPSSI